MDNNMPHDKLSFLQRLVEYGALGYVWLFIISIWGGTVRYVTDIRAGNKPSFISWLYEACISGFVGIITAMTCQYYQLDFLLTSAITGIAAHNGTRSLFVLAECLKKNSNLSTVNIGEQNQPEARLSMTRPTNKSGDENE